MSERNIGHPEFSPTAPNAEDMVQLLESLEFFSPEDLHDLLEMPLDEALGYAYTLAIENGMDAEELTLALVQAGLLEPETA